MAQVLEFPQQRCQCDDCKELKKNDPSVYAVISKLMNKTTRSGS